MIGPTSIRHHLVWNMHLYRKLFSENIPNRDFKTRVRTKQSFVYCTIIPLVDQPNYTKSLSAAGLNIRMLLSQSDSNCSIIMLLVQEHCLHLSQRIHRRRDCKDICCTDRLLYSICHAWAAFAGISPSFPEPKASWRNVKQVPCHWFPPQWGSKKNSHPHRSPGMTDSTSHSSASCVFCWFSIKKFPRDTEKEMLTITAKITRKSNTCLTTHTRV